MVHLGAWGRRMYMRQSRRERAYSSWRSRIFIQMHVYLPSGWMSMWEQAARVILSLSLSLSFFFTACPEAEVCKQTRKIAQCQAPERAAVFRFMWHRTRDKLCGFSVTCRQQSWIMLRIRRANGNCELSQSSSEVFSRSGRRFVEGFSRTRLGRTFAHGWTDIARLWDYRRKFKWN